MLKTIGQHSTKLVAFLSALKLALYQPQIQHFTQIIDALLVSDTKKTLSNLYRYLEEEPDPKTAAYFFRESPWQSEAINRRRKFFMLQKFLGFAQLLGLAPTILASVDDSLGEKDKATRHLEAVDFHRNHSESNRKKQAYTNGYVYVEVHGQIGPNGFTFDTRLYMWEKTVRSLNRQRDPEHHLRYRTKYALAREMLV